MARRRPARGRGRDPEEEPVEQEEAVQEQQPEPEEPEESEQVDQEADESAVEEEEDQDDEVRTLQFRDELSWRPAKPIASATLVARLERLSKELADHDQGAIDLDSVKDVAEKLAHRNLIQHKDRGMMFSLFVKDILPALYDPTNPYNMQHKYVLLSLTEVKSVLLIFDISGSDKLVLELFNSTFDGISNSSKSKSGEQVAKDVEIHLGTMLSLLIDEAPGSVPASVIDAIISQFLRAAPPGGVRSKEQNGNQSTLLHKTERPAYLMASKICNECADKMTRYVSQYFSDVIIGASSFATKSNGHQQGEDSDEEDANAGPSENDLKSLRQAHLLIRELWRTAPTILQNVVPQIDAELSADNLYLRQLATETFGDMISGIGAAGPPPPPVLDCTAYPPLRLLDDPSSTSLESGNALTKPYSPHSFAQTHSTTYRNFVGRKNDKAGVIRAAWATAAGYILATSAGGIGLSRVEENELIKALAEKLNDSEEKVRLAAVKAIELFDFRDIILKLGTAGGIDKEGSIFANLGDRSRDRKQAVRVEAMVLLGKLWAVGAAEIADGQEAVTACLAGVPSRIFNAFYANDADLNVLLDRVMFECLVPLKYPLVKGKDGKAKSGSSQSKSGGLSAAEQDTLRAERILLMLKSLDSPAQKAFFAMQARQPQFAIAVGLFVKQCEAYNGGVNVEGSEEKIKASMNKTLHWLGAYFPDQLKVRNDLHKLAKLNDRRAYQLIKYTIESESDFQKVRRSIHELIPKLQESNAASSLDTLIPLLYRSGSLIFNRSHLTTIMDYSKSDKDGLASVAHSVLNEISTRNPDLFKAHSEELRKSIIDQAPAASKPNDHAVVDMLKAFSSYSKKYPDEVKPDRGFTQTLMNYALYGSPPKAAKYAVNILLAKNDDKSKVTATTLLQKVMKGLEFGSPNYLNKLATISQLARLAPTVTADSDDAISELTINGTLREVRTDAKPTDPSWVSEADMDEELQAKTLALKILVNRALSSVEDADSQERVKPLFKLLKTLVVQEGEFCKVKDTPTHHKKRLRLLAGQSILKLCAVKKYDDQLDAASFNKLAELVQDSELQVRCSFMEKLQSYLTRGKLRARFYTILFLVAFEPVTDVKNRVETWIRSRAHFYSENKKPILEAMMGRLIPLLAHHPDYSSEQEDLVDFAKYILFYLGTVAEESNISHIYKYAERVKQTRDALDPEKSENLYVLSDLAQAVIRKYQEKRNWSFQAWPDKVGLPTGIYAALPSSEVAQQIAKKLYIPDEIDEKLDNLIRAQERKKKRKSLHESADHPAKRPKNQIKTVIRGKPKPAKTSAKKKTPKRKSTKNPNVSSSPVPLSERRRSGRAHVSSNYRERDDEEDEEEMLDGVAEWDYGSNSDMAEESEDEHDENGHEAEEDKDENNSDDEEVEEEAEEEEEQPSARRAVAKKKTKPAAEARKSSRSTRGRGRGAKAADSDMDVDDSDE
ncbi:unnamed protein product [Clonostachys rhizophaga]|uniref:Sister chromatid cohesion protein PDS5 n=1 Tax=Clonostachys rhizophaga TaxID=160324 RepID=A0A9N9VN28_9HYPO|nr:unnamed protein product [Clonostachys rhizophaga]